VSMAEAQAFFDRYADCFSARDVAGLGDMWSFPAFISGPRSGGFAERESFDANTAALCDFYVAQGSVKAEKRVIDVRQEYDNAAMVRTADRLSDAAGETIAAWEHLYLLRRQTEGWRVQAAVADAEVAAWAARGTPLGERRA
jgi:hypothetical protein